MSKDSDLLRKKLLGKRLFPRIKKQQRSLLIGLVALVLLMGMSSLYGVSCYNDNFYNQHSWTWSYAGPCTPVYNCLSYALGITNKWTWPWGVTANQNQVNSYLTSKGYYVYGTNPKIISYGYSYNSIGHFSRVTSGSTCKAKWGKLNLLNHGSWNPYYSNSCYGRKQQVYYGTAKMFVSISGPSIVYSRNGVWCASVTYGSPPYTYQWSFYDNAQNSYIIGTGQCRPFHPAMNLGGRLKVVVTDSKGNQANASKSITVHIGGYLSYSSLGLESEADKQLIKVSLSDLLDEAVAKDINSSNPYDYIDSLFFQEIVNFGPKALMSLRDMILSSKEDGLKEYILAIVSEEIARINLKGDSFAWTSAKEYCQKWDDYMINLPTSISKIINSNQSIEKKNERLVRLGIPAIPFILDEVKNGKIELKGALKSIMGSDTSVRGRNEIEDIETWEKKNHDTIHILRNLNKVYKIGD